jgi:hypothetical protein
LAEEHVDLKGETGMAIAGSMDQWRARLKMASPSQLATLDSDIESDNPLRPLISDEVLRRAADTGQAAVQTSLDPAETPSSEPVTISPTPPPGRKPAAPAAEQAPAPSALSAVPNAPAPPGGRGEPPSDPITLANRAQTAMLGGDQKTATEIFDYGLEQHGQAFLEAFEALKHESDEAPASAIHPNSGLRSVDQPQPTPVPVPKDAAEKLPVVRSDPLVTAGSAAKVPATPGGTGYDMTLNGLPRTQGGRGGALGYGGFPGRQAGRDDQEDIAPPAPPSGVDLDRALRDPPYRESLIPTPPQPAAPNSSTRQLPVVRPDPAIRVGESAGYPTGTPPPTGYDMTLNGMPRTRGGRGGALGYGGFPGSQAGRDDQENIAPRGREAVPPDYVPVPDQPVAVPPPGGGQLPVMRPDPFIKMGDAAGYPTGTPPPTGYNMTLNGMPHTEGGRGGAMGYGGFPGRQAGRDDQETNPPGVPSQSSGVDLERALKDPAYRESIIPTPPQPYVNPLPPGDTRLPILRPDRNENNTRIQQALRGSPKEEAVARNVPLPQVEAERAEELKQAREADADTPAATPPAPPAPDAIPAPAPAPAPEAVPDPANTGLRSVGKKRWSAAGTSAGVQFFDKQVETSPRRTPYPDQGTDRMGGRYKDKNGKWVGTFYDPPLGPQVIPYEPGAPPPPPDVTTVPVNAPGPAPNLPGDRPMAADPASGGLASVVQLPAQDVPMRPTPQPAQDPEPGSVRPLPAAATAVANSAPDMREPQIEEGFMSKPDIWSFLTSAGLGAMASGAPSGLQAAGIGGKVGLDQLGALRKDSRERAKTLADAQFQRERVRLGYHSEDAANRRASDQNKTSIEVANINNTGANTRQGSQQAHDAQQSVLASTLRRSEADYANYLKQNDLKDSLETKKQFYKASGHSDTTASTLAGGFAPSTDKHSPMGKDEVNASFDIAATTLFGGDATGDQLKAMIGTLPPKVASEVLTSISGAEDSSGGAAALIAALEKHGIKIGKDTPWYTGGFTDSNSLTAPRTQRPTAKTTPPAGGGGGGGRAQYRWDDATQKMVPAP